MLCSNQLSYVAIFSASPSSALRGALCVVGRIASTHFFPKNACDGSFVWVVNSMMRKATIKQVFLQQNEKNGPIKGPFLFESITIRQCSITATLSTLIGERQPHDLMDRPSF
ncbi:MAG: hypothetical protein EKE20_03900 [Candidatus Symbiopectobacterium sp. Dall1.0]|nr:hypothetical protein [Candidatus Symbiopectobacterium sp. Dall1.0]